MKIVFFGTGYFGVPSLEALNSSKHSLAAVVTSCDKPQGRNLELGTSPVKQWCQKNNLEVLQFENPNSEESIQKIRSLNPDVIVVIAYGYILSDSLLSCAGKSAINLHSSLLPKYRGAAPIHWAMINGDSQTGVSIIKITSKLDAGDILKQVATPIYDEDDYVSLEKRLAELGAEALAQTLDEIALDNYRAVPQPPLSTAYARKISKEDGKILWNQNCRNLILKIRALSLWPGSYFFYDQKRLIICKAAVSKTPTGDHVPGTVLKASPKDGLVVALQDGCLIVKEIQQEGKKRMPISDFLQGFQITEGSLLS